MGLMDFLSGKPEDVIAEKIKTFLEKEADKNGVAFNEVLIVMKLREENGTIKGVYYLQVKGAFKRYVEIKELL